MTSWYPGYKEPSLKELANDLVKKKSTPHEIIAVGDGGYYDLTTSQSVPSAPPKDADVVGKIENGSGTKKYTPTAPIKSDTAAQNAAAALEAQGYSRDQARSIVSRQRRVSHHRVHATRADNPFRPKTQQEKIQEAAEQLQKSASSPTPKVQQAGPVTTRQGAVWTLEGEKYITPIEYEKEVVELQKDRNLLKTVEVVAPERSKPSQTRPPKGWETPRLEEGKPSVWDDIAWGKYGEVPQTLMNMFRLTKANISMRARSFAEAESRALTAVGVGGPVKDVLVATAKHTGAILGGAESVLTLFHAGGAIQTTIKQRSGAINYDNPEEWVDRPDVALADFVVPVALTPIAGLDSLPRSVVEPSKADVTVAIRGKATKNTVEGLGKVRAKSGLGRMVYKKDFSFVDDLVKGEDTQFRIKNITVGTRKAYHTIIMENANTGVADDWAKVRYAEKFMQKGDDFVAYGRSSTVTRGSKGARGMDYFIGGKATDKHVANILVGNTDDGLRVVGVSDIKVVDSADDVFRSVTRVGRSGKIVKSSSFTVADSQVDDAVKSAIGGTKSTTRTTTRPSSVPRGGSAKTVAVTVPKQDVTTVSRSVTTAVARAVTSAKTANTLTRAALIAIVGGATRTAVLSDVATKQKTVLLERVSDKTAPPKLAQRQRQGTLVRQSVALRVAQKQGQSQQDTTVLRAILGESTTTRTATVTRTVPIVPPKSAPPKVVPVFPFGVKGGRGGGGIRVSRRIKAALFGERAHKVADIETLLFGRKRARRKNSTRRKRQSI